MSGYGSIGNISPPARESADSEEERDSIRTPLVLPKGRRGMRRQHASQVDNKLFRVSNTFAPILRGFSKRLDLSIFDQRSLDDYMSGYDTTSDVESGVVRC